MRRLTIAVLMVSALCVADRAFGFQQTDAPAPEKARAPKARQADRERTAGAVTARGSLQCPAVCDVRCEVSSPDEGGTPILQILPEGKLAEEGQVLVELDASGLEEQKARQRILCATSEAAASGTSRR